MVGCYVLPGLIAHYLLSGRVLVQEGDNYVTKLVNIDRDLVMIPNVAIHMNRTVNDGYAYNNKLICYRYLVDLKLNQEI